MAGTLLLGWFLGMPSNGFIFSWRNAWALRLNRVVAEAGQPERHLLAGIQSSQNALHCQYTATYSYCARLSLN
jgi:hypothetical protein